MEGSEDGWKGGGASYEFEMEIYSAHFNTALDLLLGTWTIRRDKASSQGGVRADDKGIAAME